MDAKEPNGDDARPDDKWSMTDRWAEDERAGNFFHAVSEVAWGNAGTAQYALREGRIVGLLYFDEGVVGTHTNEAGETVLTEPSWRLILPSNPEHHGRVEAPLVTPQMSDRELSEANAVALAAATAIITQNTEVE
jgi:hypothetical protein